MARHLAALGALFLLAPAGALGSPLTFPVTVAESTCAEQHLARVERRLASYGMGVVATSLGTNAVWNSAPNSAAYVGLVRLVNSGGDAFRDFASGNEHFAEADLAFNLVFTADQSVLDPRQPPTGQGTLVRRDPGTNMVADRPSCSFVPQLPDISCPVLLKFDLSATPGDSVNPALPLVVNNDSVAEPGLRGLEASPLAAASGAGPGIEADRLDQPCGGTITSFDQHVFEILARTIVPSDCYSTVPATCGNPEGVDAQGYNLAIFRGADPHVYRVNIYIYQYLCSDIGCYGTGGPLALEFTVDWDAEGHLTTGFVKVLPRCRAGQTLDCTDEFMQFGIFIVPPISPGQEIEPPAAFRGAPYLYVAGINQPSPEVLSAPINWQALLSGTALNAP